MVRVLFFSVIGGNLMGFLISRWMGMALRAFKPNLIIVGIEMAVLGTAWLILRKKS